MRLSFADLTGGAAAWVRSRPVEIEGWLCPFGWDADLSYLALVDEPPCCLGCLPHEAERRIEVFARTALPVTGSKVRLAGELRRLAFDPAGWLYQLRRACLVGYVEPPRSVLTRRRALTAASLACVAAGAAPACAAIPGAVPAAALDAVPDAMSDAVPDAVLGTLARAALAGLPTVDIHSHAGGVIGVRRVEAHAPFTPLAGPMRDGGMAAICLAAVSDSPVHRVMPDRRIRPFRDPAPGELYAYGQLSFQRIHDLAREQGLAVIADAAALASARSDRPGIVVSAEGGDFLEGQPDRVDEAHGRWTLRHLQLTHYRVNELGDIQTEAPVHGGLTSVGAEVVRRCNRLGIVVDVAHGTYDLVKQAAAVATKPLVLSHTSLSAAPGRRSRLISPDHARAVAGTGGVIGIWTPAGRFPDMPALAAGIAEMVDAVGIEHVGLGSDMGGLVGPSAFASYRDLPALSAALLGRGFHPDEVGKLLGGNYLRVFTQSMG